MTYWSASVEEEVESLIIPDDMVENIELPVDQALTPLFIERLKKGEVHYTELLFYFMPKFPGRLAEYWYTEVDEAILWSLDASIVSRSKYSSTVGDLYSAVDDPSTNDDRSELKFSAENLAFTVATVAMKVLGFKGARNQSFAFLMLFAQVKESVVQSLIDVGAMESLGMLAARVPEEHIAKFVQSGIDPHLAHSILNSSDLFDIRDNR
jgi:hypothetical protein